MNLRRRLVVSALAAPALLAGCKVRTINYFPVKSARVRFANFMLDSGPLDVFDGDTEVWSAVGFEGSTPYVDFDNVEKTFAVRVPDATTDLTSAKLALAGEQPYTYVAYGSLPSPQSILVPDPTTATGSGTMQIRLIDVSSGSSSIDIYITKPDVAVDENIGPNLAGLSSGSSTVSLRFEAGPMRVRATPNGSKALVYDSGSYEFAPDTTYDMMLYAIGSAALPQAMLIEVNATQARVPLPNTLGGVKLVNGAIDAGKVNGLSDGTEIISEVDYPGSSVYAIQTTVSHVYTFEKDATPGAAIATITRTPVSARDGTVLITGFPGAVQAIAFDDDNRLAGPGETRVRFLNGVADGSTFDVYVGDARQAQALAPRTVSAYFTIVPVSATVTFRDPASGTTLVTVESVALGEGRTTTVCVVGAAGALKSVVNNDR